MLLPFGVSLRRSTISLMVPLVTVAIGAYWHARQTAIGGALAGWTWSPDRHRPVGPRQGASPASASAGVGVAGWLVGDARPVVAAGRRRGGFAGHRRRRGLAWYAAMERAVPGYLHYFFAERHLAGFAEDTQRTPADRSGYYVPILLAGTLAVGRRAVASRARE